MKTTSKTHLVGGGFGSLADAAFMIRDKYCRKKLSLFLRQRRMWAEALMHRRPDQRYSMDCGRMMTIDNFERTGDLFKSIPSLSDKSKTVFDGTVDSNDHRKSPSAARLADRRRAKSLHVHFDALKKALNDIGVSARTITTSQGSGLAKVKKSTTMEDQGGTKNKKKCPKKSNKKQKHEAEHKRESQPEYKNLPELLQADKAAKKDTIATAIKANMKAVEKSNK